MVEPRALHASVGEREGEDREESKKESRIYTGLQLQHLRDKDRDQRITVSLRVRQGYTVELSQKNKGECLLNFRTEGMSFRLEPHVISMDTDENKPTLRYTTISK